MSTYEQILFDVQASLAIISLNRPDRLNAWTPVMEKEVADAVTRAERDPSIRAIVFTGVGRGFSSGADLQAPRPADAPPRPGPDRFMFLWHAAKPLVAAINGPAAGVGLSLTLYCNLRYIASDASISTAFAQRGLIAEHGSAWLLPRLIGQQDAADLLYSGRKVGADEAAAMGLARMLPADGFIDQVKHLVRELVKRSSPRSLRVMRRQLHAAMSSGFEEALSPSGTTRKPAMCRFSRRYRRLSRATRGSLHGSVADAKPDAGRPSRKNWKKREREMGMFSRRKMIAASAGAGLAAVLPRFAKAASYDPGANDSEIRVGQFGPLSGPVSSFGVLATAMAAYFKMLNESGGINGRKVTFINYDDTYSPPKSVEAARKLVEGDEVLLIAGSMGTPGNLAIQKYMNAKKVPQLFLAAGASRLADPAHYPWTMIYASTFEREGTVVGKYLASAMSRATIAVLYQDDDAGRATLGTLRASLGTAGPKIVSEMTYTVADPTIDSQLVQMKLSGADVVVLNTIPRMASQALQKFHTMDWHPQIFLGAGNASVTATLKPAGFEKAQGALAFATSQDPGNPIWDDQPGMKQYRTFLSLYAPTADAASSMFAAGYSIAYTVAHVLRQCGNDLTRANVLKEATSLKDFATPLLIPGITMNTSPTDYVPIKRYQLMRFKGEQYERVGDLVDSD